MATYGGYIGYECGSSRNGPHAEAIATTSGRASLALILDICKPKVLHLPYYICDVVVEVAYNKGVDVKRYNISDGFKLVDAPRVSSKEMILCVNYFGVLDKYMGELSNKYRDKMIIDSVHAYYSINKGRSWAFNSARKFFGVPDGSFLLQPSTFKIPDSFYCMSDNCNVNIKHLLYAKSDKQKVGFKYYKQNEKMVSAERIGMSRYSASVLNSLNHVRIKTTRIDNYNRYEQIIGAENAFQVIRSEESVPYAYPLITDKISDVKKLWANGIYVPVLWRSVPKSQVGSSIFEQRLHKRLFALPVDQRYTLTDIDSICDIIINTMKVEK